MSLFLTSASLNASKCNKIHDMTAESKHSWKYHLGVAGQGVALMSMDLEVDRSGLDTQSHSSRGCRVRNLISLYLFSVAAYSKFLQM